MTRRLPKRARRATRPALPLLPPVHVRQPPPRGRVLVRRVQGTTPSLPPRACRARVVRASAVASAAGRVSVASAKVAVLAARARATTPSPPLRACHVPVVPVVREAVVVRAVLARRVLVLAVLARRVLVRAAPVLRVEHVRARVRAVCVPTPA